MLYGQKYTPPQNRFFCNYVGYDFGQMRKTSSFFLQTTRLDFDWVRIEVSLSLVRNAVTTSFQRTYNVVSMSIERRSKSGFSS